MIDKETAYPEGEALQAQIESRHRRGTIWRVLFQLATIIGIVTLTALLYNIINQAFGLVAVENVRAPQDIVLEYEEARMLLHENTLGSEDDRRLVEAVAGDPNGISFFGHAYFEENEDRLQAISIEGVAPVAESAEDGSYPLARPLYLYSAGTSVEEKPEVVAFINFYLQHVDEVIEEVGYFPASETVLAESREAWLEATGQKALPDVNPAEYGGEITIGGSSTLLPLTQRIAEMFEAQGFDGQVLVASGGSTGGLRSFCVDGNLDIVGSSRPIRPAEVAACRAIDRTPLEIRVGTDSLVVAVSEENGFAAEMTMEELREAFTEAALWSDVNPEWPAEPLVRYVPGFDSGTLDFFVETVFPTDLVDLRKDGLVSILASNVSEGVGRRLEREQRFYENYLVFEKQESWTEICSGDAPPAGCTEPPRSQSNIYGLVLERVVQPEIVDTWSLVDSLFNQEEILVFTQQEYPDASLEWRSWLSPSFVTQPQSDRPELAGVRTAIFGSLWVVAITIGFSFPVGVGAAIYLEEYAGASAINRVIQTNINNLAGVPSIIYGMLGLAIFVRMLEPLTSGAVFGVADPTTANGRTILAAGLTLGLLILPIIIINSQEAIRAVPSSLRQASYGLGATRWQTIWFHVLPNALPGILTGTILAMSRAIGETAPLVVIGASTFITFDPDGPFSKFTVLPIQIYQWTSRPQDEFRNIAAAAIIVLLILLLTLNATAVLLRNRFSKRLV